MIRRPEIIDQQRVIEKLDEYMSKRDYAQAERHLLYWLDEARFLGDKRGELTVTNELIGHFRKTMNKQRALEMVECALKLIEESGMNGTLSDATTCVNCGTALNAFGENERSLELFLIAKNIYENADASEARLLGGLYNNMALTLMALGRSGESRSFFEKALVTMESDPRGKLEQAVTYMNLCDLVSHEKGPEEGEREIFSLLDRAEELLDDKENVRDGYYAFVLEKCAPGFEHYGYFVTAARLKNESRIIYESLGMSVTNT